MINFVAFAVLSTAFHQVSAHYNFGYLEINGVRSKPWEFVRNVTAYEGQQSLVATTEYRQRWPQYDPTSTNITCGREAVKYAPKAKTATIAAGSKLSFRVLPWFEEKMTGRYNNTIFHDGPANVYMAKLPEGQTLETWDGVDGEWFKIAEWLARNETTWIVDQYVPAVNFTLPEKTPPGKYLMRVEQYAFIGPRTPDLQFYPNCAHVEVTGPGGGMPKEFAKFPGAYDYKEMNKRFDVANKAKDFRLYRGEGPPIWNGE